jgi:hypothetical protein
LFPAVLFGLSERISLHAFARRFLRRIQLPRFAIGADGLGLLADAGRAINELEGRLVAEKASGPCSDEQDAEREEKDRAHNDGRAVISRQGRPEERQQRKTSRGDIEHGILQAGTLGLCKEPILPQPYRPDSGKKEKQKPPLSPANPTYEIIPVFYSKFISHRTLIIELG